MNNLLSNAIKFTNIGGHINVDSTVKNGMIQISISDDGVGIPVEEQDNIFEAFAQVEEYDVRQFGGTGLGLTLVKRLINMHGGNIWVTSKPGEGSIFTFTIPIYDENINR